MHVNLRTLRPRLSLAAMTGVDRKLRDATPIICHPIDVEVWPAARCTIINGSEVSRIPELQNIVHSRVGGRGQGNDH